MTKVVASNDTYEMLRYEAGEERPVLMSHNKEVIDQRADWVFRLLQSWGASDKIAQSMAEYMNEGRPHVQRSNKPVSPQELVIQVCEVVDAAWNEMHHRGWIVKAKSLGD